MAVDTGAGPVDLEVDEVQSELADVVAAGAYLEGASAHFAAPGDEVGAVLAGLAAAGQGDYSGGRDSG